MAAAAAALVTVVFWASAFVGIRSAGRVFSPGALSLGRLLVGLVALVAVSLVPREDLPSHDTLRAVAGPLLVAGVLWFGAYNPILNSAERPAAAGTATRHVHARPIPTALPAAVGSVPWAFPLSRPDAGRLGAPTYLVPPLSLLFGWLWLGESPAAVASLGGALCLAGVALSRARRVSLPLLVRSRRGRPD